MISQIIGYIALWLITRSGGGMDVYYEQVVLLTGLTGILSMIPCLWFYSRDRIARKHGGLVLPQKPWKLDLPEIILLLGNGSSFFTVCKYACRNAAVCTELSGISGDNGSDDCRKEYVVFTHMYGCYSASGRGNRISLADLFATPGLYENRICHGDLRNDLWYLSWKSGTGSLCRNSWNGICRFSGNQRLSVEQRTFAYGGKYLVACISGSCELDATEKSNVYSDHAVCIDTHFGLWVSLFPGKGERTDKTGFVNAYRTAEFCF